MQIAPAAPRCSCWLSGPSACWRPRTLPGKPRPSRPTRPSRLSQMTVRGCGGTTAGRAGRAGRSLCDPEPLSHAARVGHATPGARHRRHRRLGNRFSRNRASLSLASHPSNPPGAARRRRSRFGALPSTTMSSASAGCSPEELSRCESLECRFAAEAAARSRRAYGDLEGAVRGVALLLLSPQRRGMRRRARTRASLRYSRGCERSMSRPQSRASGF